MTKKSTKRDGPRTTAASKRGAVEKKQPSAQSGSGAASNEDEDDSPYPGLNYYEGRHRDLFAGRKDEILKCGDMLFSSRVLLLHGPTGCGKSSFLRAGVKPRIARLDKEARFAGGPDQFDVIRSTEQPLLRFVERLADIVAEVEKELPKTKGKSGKYGPLSSTDAFASAATAFSTQDKINLMGRRARAAYAAYKGLLAALAHPLILVIDQGEEVFTLNDERRLREEYARREKVAKEKDETIPSFEQALKLRQDELDAYFEFLRLVAAEGGGPLIISLRTEYKGQFDDCIAGTVGHPGPWLKGFFLDQLGEKALIAAIRRPALSKAEWEALKAEGEVDEDAPPPARIKLEFSVERAQELARELLKVDAVPPGGVLPALQVACKRLYKQVLDASDGKTLTVKVSRPALMRLGAVATQVEEYVSDCIERACKVADEPSQAIDLVHRGLAKFLVGVEPDGRAVTRRLPNSELHTTLKDFFGDRLKNLQVVLNELVHAKVLRVEQPIGGSIREKVWSLGHDSIALALSKWRTPAGREDPAMMRMAMMGGTGQPSTWTREQLYPDNELKSMPPPMKLAVPRDFLWDRQLPFLAAEKGFDRRLGFTIVSEESLDATKIGAGPPDWMDLVKRVKDESERLVHEEKRASSMLVAAEWGAFPLIIRKTGGEGEGEEVDRDLIEMKDTLAPEKYARYWTDIATTNTNFGNGLIGPEVEGLKTLSQIERDTDGRKVEAVRDGVREILTYLVDTKAEVTHFDLRARRMLLLAADLVFTEGEEGERERIKARLSRGVTSYRSGQYQIKDPIVERLMRQDELEVKWIKREDKPGERPLGKGRERRIAMVDDKPLEEGRQLFAVAGAFPRAMATQSGFKVYFGAKHVAWLAREEMDYRKSKKKPLYAPNVSDLAEAMQRIISHTVWQFSLPNARWDFGADRARVLRLAALAYYTTEYARSSMDETVAFLQRFANGFLERDDPGPNSLKGVRLSRAQVREAVAECFNFVRFDEYANEVFDLDAPFAYWSDHSKFESKSVAQAIYQEMVALRQATLTHFDTVVGAISWMRYDDLYFPQKDPIVRDAFIAKELAWKHFRIFNFYDSERFMSSAASALSNRLETILQAQDLAEWRAEFGKARASLPQAAE